MMGSAAGDAVGEPQDLPPVSSAAVAIRDYAFTPAHIRVAPGETVVWTNEDSVAHTVTGSAGDELSSPLLSRGDEFSYTFATPGNFAYYCTPHPWMTGVVTVG
jgi:plastocyanin